MGNCDIIFDLKALKRGVKSGKYFLKIATSTAEKQQAFRLRYDIFNEELGEGLASSVLTKMDTDSFDEICDHLIVFCDDIAVGTYRILPGSKRTDKGFYTEGEFNLLPWFKSVKDFNFSRVVELGRGCIHKEHRKKGVLLFIFWGLQKYIEAIGAEFFIGCGSLPKEATPEDAMCTYENLLSNGKVCAIDKLSPTAEFSFEYNKTIPAKIIIPSLIELYLQIGAKVYSTPAFDKEFGCFDLLVIYSAQDCSNWWSSFYKKYDNRRKRMIIDDNNKAQ